MERLLLIMIHKPTLSKGIQWSKYSGSLNARLTPEIHSHIAMLAQRAGISINAFIKQALEKQITAMLQNRNLLQIHTEQCRI
ncbi:type II toxin-antitoxin system HicB family antitoxin [Bacteroides intestinalis]|uniref:type II toxin-antitoxin system HicB family antitoxin n=1 Tax=Bacteroides intestinalis TaxID=329854 RepID=UPI00216B0B41|nr:type II toxin-antitoxin system HicB family antitoxin [Bacteroides intestinalis]